MSSNEHLEAIRDCIRRAQYPQQIGPRKQTEERDLYYATILRHAEALATALAEAEARADRWKRMALAHDAYEDALLCGRDGNEQERVREELRAAHTDLKAHGDLGDES